MMQYLFTQTPLAYFVSSFWRDEAFSYLMAKLPITSLLWTTAQDANPPLYYLLLKVWMALFGSSELAIRSLSFIFFWATLYVVYLILKNSLNISPRKSLLYLLLFIINPLLHYYAFEARMYSMMAFLASLLFYLFLKKEYKLYAFVALISLLTHYFLLLVILFQAGIVYFSYHKSEQKKFYTALLKSIVWFTPWLGMLILARPPVSGSFWIQDSNIKDLFLLPALIITGYEQGSWMVVSFISWISLLISGIVLFGLYKLTSQKRKLPLPLLFGWAIGIPLVIFIVSFIKPVFLPRYLIFSSVGMTVLLILCLEQIANIYLRSVVIGAVVLSLLSYSSIQVKMRNKAPLKKIFYSISREMREKDVLYVTNEYDFHPAEYYLPKKKVYIYKKTYEELPWFVGKVLMSKQAFQTALPIYPTRAFILNNDGSYTIQSSR